MSNVKKQPKPDHIASPETPKEPIRVVIDDETGNELRELETSINNLQQHYRTRLSLYRRLNKLPDFPKSPQIPDPVRLEYDQANGKYMLVWTKEEKKSK